MENEVAKAGLLVKMKVVIMKKRSSYLEDDELRESFYSVLLSSDQFKESLSGRESNSVKGRFSKGKEVNTQFTNRRMS